VGFVFLSGSESLQVIYRLFIYAGDPIGDPFFLFSELEVIGRFVDIS
jgi:hypothetical protein